MKWTGFGGGETEMQRNQSLKEFFLIWLPPPPPRRELIYLSEKLKLASSFAEYILNISIFLQQSIFN